MTTLNRAAQLQAFLVALSFQPLAVAQQETPFRVGPFGAIQRDAGKHQVERRRVRRMREDVPGSPAGLELRKIVDTGIRPVITTGIAHREAGIGQIGAGIVRAPMACFVQALRALASQSLSSAGAK